MAYASGITTYSSQLSIVATTNNTTVTITPSATASLVGHSGTYTETLQQGQTYEIDCSANSDDVTGTQITSDNPIAVFAGANLAHVPLDSAYGNPLTEEQLPTAQWGMEALSMGFAQRVNGDTYRVLAINTNTIIFTNGVIAGTNQAGQFLEFVIKGPVVFQSTQPVQVAHFQNGADFDGASNLQGDPAEILIPPAGDYLVTNLVATPTYSGGFTHTYINLIVMSSAITNTSLDNMAVAVTNFVPIGTSGYFGARLLVTNSVHTVTSSQPVGVEVYGMGEADAFGYFGGVVK
jgi:adhesin/invasin